MRVNQLDPRSRVRTRSSPVEVTFRALVHKLAIEYRPVSKENSTDHYIVPRAGG